jgi:hypothetical protein
MQIWWMSYLLMGMATAAFMWTTMADELDMSIASQLDDEEDVGTMRTVLTLFLLVAWPVAMVELVRGRR